MQFNSLYFLLFFLPLVLAGYYGLAGRGRRDLADWLLILASFLFYGSTNLWYVPMLGILLALNWCIARQIQGCRQEAVREKAAGGWMTAGIVLNVGFLGFFKYTNFLLENLNVLLRQDWPMVHLILPLGISFLIFSQISFLADVRRGTIPGTRQEEGGERICLREYVLYSVFFPKLTQGPIASMREFLPELRREKRGSFSSEEVSCAVQMFICGLFKKTVLADPLGSMVSQYYSQFSYRSNVDSLLVMLAYTLQIYLDFSGYSDMAIGLAGMLGIRLRPNFNSPYKACSVTDFWRRWHMSLTSFLREYIYFPLGGSRKGRIRTYRNILLVYLVSGIWHGANWTFVLWGLLHGLAQVAERLLGRFYQRVWRPVRWTITFGAVSLLWMLFRSDSVAEFRRFWWHLRVDRSWYFSDDLASCLHITGVRAVLSFLQLPCSEQAVGGVCAAVFLGGCLLLCLAAPNNQERRYRTTPVTLAAAVGMLLWCLLSMSGVSSFIYNDF